MYRGAVLLLSTLALLAIAGTETDKIVGDDSLPGDGFGATVSLEGDLAAVGAIGANGLTGAGYVYRRSGGVWIKEARLDPSDGGTGVFMGFGASASASAYGDVAVFGAILAEGPPGVTSGAAYVYRRVGGVWTPETKLFPTTATGFLFFGFRTDLSGDLCVVASPNEGPPGIPVGATYVYRYDGANWVHEDVLVPSLPATGLQSGTELSLSTSGGVERVLAGNPADGSHGFITGSATIFRRNDANWIEEQHLQAAVPTGGEWFGRDVGLCGNTAIVGAPRATGAAAESGVAYIFRFDGSTWNQEARLFAPDGVADERYGLSVDIEGDNAVIGSLAAEGGLGAIYYYRYDGSAWNFVDKLITAAREVDDGFSEIIGLSGNTLIASAGGDTNSNGAGAGAFYTFDLSPPPDTDTDGDGLLDSWETDGFTAADGTFVNLRDMGADPLRKDIFVEVDYMTGHKPVDLQAVIDAFAAAPIDTDGINLHIMIDDEIPFVASLGGTAPSGKYEWNGTDGNKTYFQDIKDHPDYGLTPSLKKIAHYCVFADTIDFGDGTFSGISRATEEGGVAGSDFIVSLGGLGAGQVGSMIQQRGTFMHELGHNLGLRHGGGDSTKGKPNYLSVMNYFFQLDGLDCGAAGICVDFSHQELPPLNEDDLDETVGIGGAANRGTAMRNGSASEVRRIADASGAIDWNNDDDTTDTGLVFDLNGDNLPIPGAVPGSIFAGFNDWANLVFKGGSIGAPGAGAPPPQPDTTEPPEELDQETFASLGPPAPEGLKGHSADPQTTLTWKPAANVTYNVYRTQAGDIEFLGNTTQSNYHDKTAVDGVEYVYSVASVSGTGTEGPSTSVTVVTR